MTDPEPRVQATRYTVNCMPPDSCPDAHAWALHVELGRDGYWSITNGHQYLDTCGIWHDTRWGAGPLTLGNALAIAEATAPHMSVNGFTPDTALERIARLQAEPAE
ncbi:hypothetical protein ACFYUY_01675 [Kitasatospora sp. NPDC004745]|uniref:hypothetical protein n=1 Tax=Kitasatospora sp. NPDC004745 TaxID=3364019 RepID=UPI0036B1FC11